MSGSQRVLVYYCWEGALKSAPKDLICILLLGNDYEGKLEERAQSFTVELRAYNTRRSSFMFGRVLDEPQSCILRGDFVEVGHVSRKWYSRGVAAIE
jgi:hypothetical protein